MWRKACATTSATLNGTGANPDLAGASTFFQYGTTAAYGSLAPAQAIAATTPQAPISALAGALAPGTLYHFRLVVQNGVSTARGADQTFTTSPTAVAGPGTSKAPTVANASQSHSVWREGKKSAVLSRRSKKKAPVGTTFAFTLDQPASARFVFTQQVGGRSVKGRCVARKPSQTASSARANAWLPAARSPSPPTPA